jgi:RNA recognition motif-containing protein
MGRFDMAKKLFVGGLSFDETDETLRALFSAHGTVNSAQIIMDRDTGRSKGFGFVEMSSDTDSNEAIQQVNGRTVNGRSLMVNEARPKEARSGGGGYGGGGSRGGSRRY